MTDRDFAKSIFPDCRDIKPGYPLDPDSRTFYVTNTKNINWEFGIAAFIVSLCAGITYALLVPASTTAGLLVSAVVFACVLLAMRYFILQRVFPHQFCGNYKVSINLAQKVLTFSSHVGVVHTITFDKLNTYKGLDR